MISRHCLPLAVLSRNCDGISPRPQSNKEGKKRVLWLVEGVPCYSSQYLLCLFVPLPLLTSSLRPWRLHVAGQRFSLGIFMKRRMTFLSLCICLFAELKLIDYNAPFWSSECRQRFDKAFCCALCVGCTLKSWWFYIIVCLWLPYCSWLRDTVVLLNAHPGAAVIWPTLFSCSVIPSLPCL